MENSIDLKKIKQKTYRYSQQDGLIEIVMGAFFVFYGGYFYHVLSGFTSKFPWGIIFVFGFSYIIIEWIRKRVTYPRIGRVKIIEEIKLLYVVPAAVTLIAVPLIAYIAYLVSWNIDPYVPWLPALFGVMLAGLFQGTIKNISDICYYAFVTLSVVSGILLSLFDFASPDTSILAFFLIVGISLLIFGVGKFLHFIRTVPVAEAKDDE
jgi:hypothetical protein